MRGAHIRVCTAATSAQPVDEHLEQRAEKHTAEEAGGRHRDGAALAEASIRRGYGCERLDEDLDERDVQHHASGEGKRDGKHDLLRHALETIGKEDERTADRGGEAGTDAHADCREYPLRACPRNRGVTWTARRVGHLGPRLVRGRDREGRNGFLKWIGLEAKSNRRFHFEVRSKGAGYLRNPSAKDLHLKTTHTLSLPPPVLQVSRKNASS